MKSSDSEPSVGIVVEVLPPEQNTGAFGHEMDGEAVRVAFPSSLDEGPGAWRDYHPAILASYCDDQDIKLWTYEHENLAFAENPYVPGDEVIKTSHSDPDTAVVIESPDGSDEVTVAFFADYEEIDLLPTGLVDYCGENGIKCYTYEHPEIEFSVVQN